MRTTALTAGSVVVLLLALPISAALAQSGEVPALGADQTERASPFADVLPLAVGDAVLQWTTIEGSDVRARLEVGNSVAQQGLTRVDQFLAQVGQPDESALSVATSVYEADEHFASLTAVRVAGVSDVSLIGAVMELLLGEPLTTEPASREAVQVGPLHLVQVDDVVWLIDAPETGLDLALAAVTGQEPTATEQGDD